MSDIGQPTQNALVERFIRTLREEHVEYADLDDARCQFQYWLEVEYVTLRSHSSLGYLTPAEFEAAVLARETPPLAIA